MNNNLVVDDQQEFPDKASVVTSQPLILRLLAKLISLIFHPLFVPVYIVIFLVYIQPYLYSGFSDWDKKVIIIQAAVMYTMFPLVTVSLLKALKFIDSFMLRTQRDRIIPYIACVFYYFWAWWVRHNLPETAHELVYFSLGVFITACLGSLFNIFMKVSMHAMAMGVASTFLLFLGFSQDISFTFFVSFALLMTGLVCSARLVLGDHTPNEIYIGLLLGALGQLVGYVMA